MITGDEEGPAINGTRKVLAWLKQRGETLDALPASATQSYGCPLRGRPSRGNEPV